MNAKFSKTFSVRKSLFTLNFFPYRSQKLIPAKLDFFHGRSQKLPSKKFLPTEGSTLKVISVNLADANELKWMQKNLKICSWHPPTIIVGKVS